MKSTITSIFLYLSMFLMSNPLFAQGEFVTDWDLSLSAGSGGTQIVFRKDVTGAAANYTWREVPSGTITSGTIPTGSGDFTLSGLPVGATIRLSIEPTNLKRFATGSNSDAPRLKDVRAWGTAVWTNMSSAFGGATNMTMSATDIPNLANVTNMSVMFFNTSSFIDNSSIGTWNTANVTNMSHMFSASSFNGNISNWNTANVTNMNSMFTKNMFRNLVL